MSCNAYMNFDKHSDLFQDEEYKSLKNKNYIRYLKNDTEYDQTLSSNDVRKIRYIFLIFGVSIFIVICVILRCILI